MSSPIVRRTIVSTPAARIVVMKVVVAASVDRRYSGVASVGLYGIKLTIKRSECGLSSAASAAASSGLSLIPRSKMYSTIATLLVGVWGRAAAIWASSAPIRRGSG